MTDSTLNVNKPSDLKSKRNSPFTVVLQLAVPSFPSFCVSADRPPNKRRNYLSKESLHCCLPSFLSLLILPPPHSLRFYIASFESLTHSTQDWLIATNLSITVSDSHYWVFKGNHIFVRVISSPLFGLVQQVSWPPFAVHYILYTVNIQLYLQFRAFWHTQIKTEQTSSSTAKHQQPAIEKRLIDRNRHFQPPVSPPTTHTTSCLYTRIAQTAELAL